MTFALRSISVQLKEKDKNLKGELHIPDQNKKALPLVLIVPEWWGKNDFSEQKAQNISKHFGYAALAVDLYGDSKNVSTPEEALQLATPFYKDPEIGVNILKKFIEIALKVAQKENITIDSSKIAALGYCFGGTQVLNLARMGDLKDGNKLLGVISVHGKLESKLKAHAPMNTKILVLHGGADQSVSPEEVKSFKEEMKNSQATLIFHTYPDAAHAFSNPKATEIGKKFDMPIQYNSGADHDSWDQIKSFLFSIFG